VLLTLAAPADVATLRSPDLAPALNVLVALVVMAGAPGVPAGHHHALAVFLVRRPGWRSVVAVCHVQAGGLIATAFVALAAPLIFSTVYEYPLLVVSGVSVLAVFPGAVRLARRRNVPNATARLAWRLLPYLAVSGALLVLLDGSDPGMASAVLRLLVFGAIVVAAAIDMRVVAGATAVVLAVLVGTAPSADLLRVRTFFGVVAGLIYAPTPEDAARFQAGPSSWLVAADPATVARFTA
jgi:hypothetical protein